MRVDGQYLLLRLQLTFAGDGEMSHNSHKSQNISFAHLFWPRLFTAFTVTSPSTTDTFGFQKIDIISSYENNFFFQVSVFIVSAEAVSCWAA